MTKDEAIEFIKETLMELNGKGILIIDQDVVEQELEILSEIGFFKEIEEDEDCIDGLEDFDDEE